MIEKDIVSHFNAENTKIIKVEKKGDGTVIRYLENGKKIVLNNNLEEDSDENK